MKGFVVNSFLKVLLGSFLVGACSVAYADGSWRGSMSPPGRMSDTIEVKWYDGGAYNYNAGACARRTSSTNAHVILEAKIDGRWSRVSKSYSINSRSSWFCFKKPGGKKVNNVRVRNCEGRYLGACSSWKYMM